MLIITKKYNRYHRYFLQYLWNILDIFSVIHVTFPVCQSNIKCKVLSIVENVTEAMTISCNGKKIDVNGD